jgi:uncharacterized membrane protein YdjX (TVP38/TMEM64 family)
MRLNPRTARHARLGAVALVIVALAVAFEADLLAQFADPKSLSQALVAMGPGAISRHRGLYGASAVRCARHGLFTVAAPLIWPWQTAFLLSMAGTMSASVVGFSFARFVAREWVSARIPARLRRYDDALGRNGFQTVVLLRLILWMPQVLHSFFGVSKVGFWTHFWDSLIGYIPPLLVVSYLGGEMFDGAGRMTPAAWPIMTGFGAASLLIAALAPGLAATAATQRAASALESSGCPLLARDGGGRARDHLRRRLARYPHEPGEREGNRLEPVHRSTGRFVEACDDVAYDLESRRRDALRPVNQAIREPERLAPDRLRHPERAGHGTLDDVRADADAVNEHPSVALPQ